MKITVRPAMLGRSPALFAYRPRERSQTLATAHEAPSGKWIVSLPQMPLDAVDTMDEAEAMLFRFFEARSDVF